MASEPPLLELRNVRKFFPVRGGLFRRIVGSVRAVDDVSFSLNEGETLSIVGESGCGKTTTARIILNLEKPSEGSVLFKGRSLHDLDADGLRFFRSSVQAVFQDPWSSLNPRLKVRTIIGEPLVVNQHLSASDLRERVAELLVQVGLRAEQADLYPHQFSGGQRQRIAIARALSLNPKLIVLDEPVSALDVSIRAQILNLLKDLQAKMGISYIMIAHHLATVRHMSHYVAVMYLGQIVEFGTAHDLFRDPRHPYTKALYSAALSTQFRTDAFSSVIQGELPSPMAPPTGCRFHTRCPTATLECSIHEPTLTEISNGHFVQNCSCVVV